MKVKDTIGDCRDQSAHGFELIASHQTRTSARSKSAHFEGEKSAVKRVIALLLALAVGFPAAAFAVPISKPNTFTTGQVIDAGQLNADWDVLYAWANGQVDNTNIGTAGIFASQIKPTSPAQATFSSAWGWTITDTSPSQITLTVNAPNGQTAPILNAAVNGVNQFSVASDGSVNSNGALNLNASSTSGVFQTNTTGSLPAFIFNNYNTTPTTGDIARFQLNGSTKFTIQNSGIPTWTGALGLAQGGTGSTSQPFVDLTTAQSIGGTKTFTSAPTFAGANINGALTGATTITTSGSAAIGDGTGNKTIAVNGGNAGTSGGSAIYFQTAGATNFAIGYKSAILGGAFDNTRYIYTTGAGLSTDGPFTSTGLGTFVGLTAGTGTVKGASDGATNAYLPPVYGPTGAPLAGTTHILTSTASVVGTGASQSVTIALTNAGAFASLPTFAFASCYTATATSFVPLVFQGANSTGNSLIFTTATGGASLTNGTTYTCAYMAI